MGVSAQAPKTAGLWRECGDTHPIGYDMYKDETFRCIKDLHQENGRIAFVKGNEYQLEDYGPENGRIFKNEDGQIHMLNYTDFCTHFRCTQN